MQRLIVVCTHCGERIEEDPYVRDIDMWRTADAEHSRYCWANSRACVHVPVVIEESRLEDYGWGPCFPVAP